MKKLHLQILLLVLLPSILIFNSCGSTEPETIDYHNKILFTSNRSGKSQLYIMNPDGTDIKQITSGQYWHNNGRWSPDAQKIVCNTEEGTTTAGFEMVVMSSDGSKRTLLGWGNYMSWSPDGKKIAFTNMPMAELGLRFRFIYIINNDGTDRKQITRDSLEIISSPCWSNEGNKIFFASNRYNVTNYNASELYYMNDNGTDVTKLTYTDDGSSYSPSISPAGSKIVFISTMNGLTKRFTIDYFSNKKDYTAALYTADQLLKETKLDEDFTCDILYAKGLIYSYDLNETVKAVDCFSGIVNNYPDNILVEGAKNELQLLGYKTVEQKKVTVEDKVSNFEIVNYPNPFNPNTTISYSLPEAGNVQIKIFDVLGREVAKLVDETKSAGKHSITWNGSNSASGIYFYTITFNNQTLYKKMLMLK